MERFQQLAKWTSPEYRERHLFVLKFRIVIFVGFLAGYIFFLHPVLDQLHLITALMIACFAMSLATYFHVLLERWIIPILVLNMLADLTALTAIIYLTGGPYSHYYLIYIFYVFAAGVFYDYALASFLAIGSLVAFALFLLLCQQALIPPLILEYGDEVPVHTQTPLYHFFFVCAFLGVTIYAVKIASYFSQKRERELEKANRVKSDFLATMSHELRTPLTAIIGFSELLLEEVMGKLNDEQKESVQEVFENGASLLDLINSLLDLTKIEAGKMPIEIRDVSVPALLKRVQRMIGALAQKKEQTLCIEATDDMPPIRADEQKLQQIILNLVSNAIKFTPRQGLISISAHCRNGECHFLVSDTGIGIEQEQLERIFEAFHQVDSSMTRSYGGTGLGLTLARQFVEMQGGRIWAESERGTGAKFHFVLPMRSE